MPTWSPVMFFVNLVTLCFTIAVLIVVCYYYCQRQKKCNTLPNGTNVIGITPERELVIHLLAGVNKGTEMVFGSRRMGVTTTKDDKPTKVVSWTPNKSSGFSIKVQVQWKKPLKTSFCVDDCEKTKKIWNSIFWQPTCKHATCPLNESRIF